jgi:hypothetical protein
MQMPAQHVLPSIAPVGIETAEAYWRMREALDLQSHLLVLKQIT